MKKRAQVTVFIMLAIVVVIAIILYIIVSNKPDNAYEDIFLYAQNLEGNAKIVRNTLFECIESTTKQGIIATSAQGGYYIKPKRYFQIENGFLPFYYYEGTIEYPSQTDVELAIATYVNENLQTCFKEKDFPVLVSYTKPNSIVAIEEKQVIFVIDSTITVTDKNTTHIIELRNKRFYIDSYLQGMLELAEYMSESHKEDPKYYCINCIGKLAYDKELNVDIFELPNQENIVEVVIHENRTNSPNLAAFIYLNKYTGEERSPILDI